MLDFHTGDGFSTPALREKLGPTAALWLSHTGADQASARRSDVPTTCRHVFATLRSAVMPRRVPTLAALALAALTACGMAGCGDSAHGIPAGAVAAVAGNGITEPQVNHWIAVRVRQASIGTPFQGYAVAPDPPRYERCTSGLLALARRSRRKRLPSHSQLLRTCANQRALFVREALTALITERWERAEAAAHDVRGSAAEVDRVLEQQLASRYPTRAGLQVELARHGETVAELRDRVELELLVERVQQRVDRADTAVRGAEVDRYYAAHRGEFAASRSADVRVILTRTSAEANAAKRELDRGASFASVARRRSVSQTARAGGIFDGLQPGQAPAPLESLVFSAAPHILRGPLKTFDGYWLVEVLAVRHIAAQGLAQAAPVIAAHLREERASARNRAFAQALVKRWTLRTECRPAFIVERCKEYHG
jgi:parvulin-like peptidyl-prolyl isomerase